MTEPVNPYNCSSPGVLFTGYASTRRRMMQGLRNGNSYALLGGRRCGKTSFLLEMEKDLNRDPGNGCRLLPRMLDMQAVAPRTPGDFFTAIYSLATIDCEVPAPAITGYQSFLSAMDGAKPIIERKHGAHWVLVLLIDELEAAMERLPDSECLENLRNLLTISRYKRYFRAIVTGIFSPVELAAKGSPLNNLNPEYLAILAPAEAASLIDAGFPEGMPEDLQSAVFEISGRHPYILQGILGYLWDCGSVSETNLTAASRRFVRDREGTFRRWLETFRPEGCLLYRRLLEARHEGEPEGTALAILSYHCVIDESEPGRVSIGSTIFRDWFRLNYRSEDSPVAVALEPAKIKSQPVGKRIFVVHGRDIRLRNSLFTFLRSLGLEPLDWTALVEATGNPSPHINEILKVGFKIAHSAVVLLSPDDEARLREEFRTPDDPEYEVRLSPQPRPNVLFEAGMAIASFPDRTVLVQAGWSRPFSDVAGMHMVKIDNSVERRRDLANRLRMAGCEVSDLNMSIDWQTVGDFSPKRL
jgi:predicted nucleotide-binding protein